MNAPHAASGVAPTAPEVTVVIPVYNEQDGLQALFDRLYPALDGLGRSYEVVFVDDGSRDRSVALLREQFARRPGVTRVVVLNGNFGQHMAIFAGFEQSRGQYVLTLDADLQNPPEEIPRIVAAMDDGHDYVGTIRRRRQDSLFRRLASRALNGLRERITHIRMTDQGCMMRGYGRAIIDALNQSREMHTFIPALAYLYARNPVEIEVGHEERAVGESKYSLFDLIRLNFDLMTGFSIAPLRVFSLVGLLLSLLSAGLVAVLLGRRLLLGSEANGVFTLFAIAFFLIGVLVFGVGMLGEYVGRIYLQVRDRPRYLVQAVLRAEDAPADHPSAG
ncbi:MAG: glycosyltransferase [Proteobacteria bacterium]|nr:glycosyltransferase [Pseudomonadota bacterium]